MKAYNTIVTFQVSSDGKELKSVASLSFGASWLWYGITELLHGG